MRASGWSRVWPSLFLGAAVLRAGRPGSGACCSPACRHFAGAVLPAPFFWAPFCWAPFALAMLLPPVAGAILLVWLSPFCFLAFWWVLCCPVFLGLMRWVAALLSGVFGRPQRLTTQCCWRYVALLSGTIRDPRSTYPP